MKFLPLIILISALLIPISGLSGDLKDNESVKVSISISQKQLKPGSVGELQVVFKPKEDIHINFDPPVTIKFDSNKVFSSFGKIATKKDSKTDYMDISQPIKQSFTLSKELKPGSHKLKGILTYFYCSGSSGWCSKFKQPFEITISVK